VQVEDSKDLARGPPWLRQPDVSQTAGRSPSHCASAPLPGGTSHRTRKVTGQKIGQQQNNY
jgi:hypothetical protein